MKLSRRTFLMILFLTGCVVIHLYSRNSLRVEHQYSTGFFPELASFLRGLFGVIPFSIGDILYFFLVSWIIVKIIQGFRNKTPWRNRILNVVFFCCVIYFTFNLLWGINYNRKGIAWQLGLKMGKYSVEDLKILNGELVEKVNGSRLALGYGRDGYPSKDQIFKEVIHAYENAGKRFSFIDYKKPALKSSLWGWLGNYTGFTGYYNPFTAEAQVNTTIPPFIIPYTACHEVAHQIGYAKEMEANFVGYLAAKASADTFFHYSVYLDLFFYANRNLYAIDSAVARGYRKSLDTLVKKDIEELVAFNKSHTSFVEPVIRWIYGKYLIGNEQPQGIYSYDEVTAFLLAYRNKFGKI